MRKIPGVFLALLALCACAAAEVVNTELTRTIDSTAAVVRIAITAKATGVQGAYEFAFPKSIASNIAYIAVTQQDKNLPVTSVKDSGEFTLYTVKPSGADVTLKATVVCTNILSPLPKEITQNENQYMVYKDNVYVTSPYKTVSQKTTVKLASSSIRSYTKVEPASSRGTTVTYGPYKEVKPLAFEEFAVHALNNKPFARFTSAIREVEVSHWGNVAVEEIYELVHAGARLSGGFSRFDFQSRKQSGPAFRSLKATLPAEVYNVYYRDQIGNISTSDMTWIGDSVELDLRARFPLFGGWKSQFYIGYSVPTFKMLFRENDLYKLRVKFFVPFEDVWVDEMSLKIVLPEGASNVQVQAPYGADVSRSRRFTFLDSASTGGRPVVVLKKSNLVEEHDADVIVTYNFSQSSMLVEPLMLVGAFFAFYIICIIAPRAQAMFAVNGENAHEKTE